MQILAVISGLLAALRPESLLAQINLDNIDPCPIKSVAGIGCYLNSDANPYLLNLIIGPRGMKTVFIGLLGAMVLFYAIKLLVGSSQEEQITEARTAYFQALLGAILVGGAFLLADAFTLPDSLIVNPVPINAVLENVIIAFKAFLSTALTVAIFFQGVKLIVAQDDGQIDSARKGLFYSIIGAVMMILSNAIVTAVFGRQIGIVSSEVLGIANFLVTLLGTLAVVGIIAAGILLILAVDESVKDKAKKIILSCVAALAVVIASYGLVTVFILNPP